MPRAGIAGARARVGPEHAWSLSTRVLLASTALGTFGHLNREGERIEQIAGHLPADLLTQAIDGLVLLVVFVHRVHLGRGGTAGYRRSLDTGELELFRARLQ